MIFNVNYLHPPMLRLRPQYTVTLLFLLVTVSTFAQRTIGSVGGNNGNDDRNQEENQQTVSITPDVRTWQMTDDFTFADTVAVDTLSVGYQIFNPIFKKSIANAYLGNMNTAYQSMIFEDREYKYGNLLFNSFLAYLPSAKDLPFYNTKTPYVNLTYHFGGPKVRSEERISALYTQNVNKKLNVGVSYLLSSSIGMYQAQKTDVDNFKIFSSYDGDKYSFQLAFLYNKLKTYENGGIDRSQMNYEFHELEEPQEVIMNFTSSEKHLTNNVLFYNQSLSIGTISKMNKDSVKIKLPVAKVYHTLELEQDKMVYFIEDLEDYYTTSSPFYPNINSDTIQTQDSVRVRTMRNTFQIKFNEEANSLLKFGLRAFITNDITGYRYPSRPNEYDIVSDVYTPHYRNTDTTFVTTAVGGQIFKNLGQNFWWNAGAKIYFQGYRAGDTELTGEMNSRFRVLNDTAGFFANGGIFLTTPELFENNYYSNNLEWNNDFGQKRTVKIKGGITIPTRKLELSAGSYLMNNYVYWRMDGTPTQSDGVIQVYHANLKKLFKLGRFYLHNDLVFQHSSKDEIIPLPQLAYYNSTYYQNTLFQVLHFQIGFDFRYNSSYYAPFYSPAIGQFTVQHEEKVGDYPWLDAFINLQLKRARIYIKYDHVNQGYPNSPYYTTYNYPGNPRALKFGVSWNFYD